MLGRYGVGIETVTSEGVACDESGSNVTDADTWTDFTVCDEGLEGSIVLLYSVCVMISEAKQMIKSVSANNALVGETFIGYLHLSVMQSLTPHLLFLKMHSMR